MKQCLHCYGIRCNDRCRPPERETNFWEITNGETALGEFLSKVITDCRVCPANTFCSRNRQDCKSKLVRWLSALPKKGGLQ